MAFSVTRAKATARRQILAFGGTGQLRRGSSNRDAAMVILDYNPRDAALVEEGARRCLIAAQDLDIPPDREQDLVVFGGEVMRIVSPIRGLKPTGEFIYYDIAVLYQEQA